jgi:outer membrane protein
MKNPSSMTIPALGLFVSLLSSSVQSETLLQVYALAAKNDHQYKANVAQFNANKEASTIARSALLPQIRGNVSYSDRDSETAIAGTTTSDTSTETTEYSVSLEQNLINFNALNNFRSGKKQAAAAEIQLLADQQSLIIRSARAYFNVLRAIDQLRTTESEEKALETQLQQTQQRYEVGLISINDVHETRAAYDSSVANKLNAKVNVGISLEGLTIITGQQHTHVAPLKKDFVATLPQPNDKQSWIDKAKQNNLSLQVSKLNAEASSYSTKAARGNRLPSLTATLSHGNADTNRSGSDLSSSPSTFDTDQDTDTTSIGLNLSVPIYNGGSLSALQRQAAQNQIRTEEEYLLNLRNTVQETRSLYLSVTTDIAQIKARKQAIVSNESALEATQAGYEAGTRDIVDVVNAQRNLFQAQRDYFTALYDYIINTLELKQVAGNLSVEDLKQLEAWLQADQKVIY